MIHLLTQLLTEAATRAPRRCAVLAPDRTLTYEQLDQHSDRLASTLRESGVGHGDRVGILAPKSDASVTAAYATLKRGACYVPLDPRSPDQRLSMIVVECGMRAVITDAANAERALALAAHAPELETVIVAGPQPGGEVVRSNGRTSTARGALAEPAPIDTDLAYILYTSGSTGSPKGVAISHRASLTFVRWAARCTALEPEDRVCSPAPLHFDLSVFDIFATCSAGACMVIVPDRLSMFPSRLGEWIERQRISVWYSVPSVLTLLANHGNLSALDLRRLRTVIFAGEVFPAKHLSLLMEQLPHARHLNWYGPTETNVCTSYEVPAGRGPLSGPVPLGRACTNMDVFAVADDGTPVTLPGDEGELLVRGSGLMHGYWRQPEKTRQALVDNPLQPAYAEPAYRTGDLVTLDEDRNFVFLGRRDGMIKTRGYRVELGEIETVLYGHPAIREAVVLPVPDELLGNRLRAVICCERDDEAAQEEVLEHCRARLPGYMVPDVIEFSDSLPRTSTGKVDRVRLSSVVASSS